MPNIKCTNCGAVLKTPTVIAPGKKVKCPKCNEPFIVQADEVRKKPASVPEEEDGGAFKGLTGGDEDAPAPKKKGKGDLASKKKTNADSADDNGTDGESDGEDKSKKKPKKGSAMIFIILGGALLFCCIGCGTVSFIFQSGLKKLAGFGDEFAKKMDDAAKKAKADQDKTKGPDQGKENPPPVLKAEFSMTAEKFSEEFGKDADAAGKKFTEKVIEITGTVKEVSFFGGERKLGVSLDGGEFAINTVIHPSSHDKVYRLSKGQKVKVVSPFKGSFGRMLSLDESVLTEVTPSQIVEVTSENLAAAYANNSGEADGKYRDKTLRVTGQVVDVQKDKENRQFATLKSGNKLTVKVLANSLGSLEVDKLAKGQTAVIRVDHLNFQPALSTITLSQIAVAESK